MPEALTHYLFASELINSLESKYKETANITEPKIFLYSNFYDLGYYYRLKGLFAKDPYKLSQKMHSTSANKIIEEAIIYTKNNGYDKDNICMIFGLVSHYVLDLFMHPYINAFTNKYDPSNKATKIHRGEHGKLERDIDYHLVLDKKGIELGKINIAKRFKGAFIFNFEDYALIDYIVKKTFYVSRSFEYYRTSLNRYKHFLLYTSKDFLNIKKLFYSLNDLTFNRKSNTLTKNFIYPKKYKYKGDPLNKENKSWYNSRTNSDTNMSFIDLYNEALRQGKLYLEAVIKYLFFNEDKEFNKLFKETNIN